MATILKTDGTTVEVEPTNGRAFTLRELSAAIGGGYIEIVRLPDRKHYLVVDEEGLLKGLPRNEAATRLYHGWPLALAENAPIAGDALYCRVSEVD